MTDHSTSRTETRANWRKAALAIAGSEAAITVALTRISGVPVVWSALVALPVSAVVFLLFAAPPGVEPTWSAPPLPRSAMSHLDATMLASRLDDAATDHSRFRGRIQPRLGRLALASLRRRPGLGDVTDLADPRAADALGPDLHALLVDPTATLPDPATLLTLLTRLENPMTAPAPTAVEPRREES